MRHKDFEIVLNRHIDKITKVLSKKARNILLQMIGCITSKGRQQCRLRPRKMH